MGLQTFYGKGPHLLLGAGKLASHGKVTVSGIPYFPTPWGRVLLEKLTGLQLVKKFPAFYGIQRFITTFTSAYHLSLS
jgi:hypothetical protein